VQADCSCNDTYLKYDYRYRKQTMYVYRNSVARSRNHCCHGNASLRSLLSFTYICRCQKYETHSGLCVKCQTFCSISNKFWVSQLTFVEVPNIKFDKNSSTGSRAVICRRTNMTKPPADFRNCAFAPNTRTQKEDRSSYTQDYGLLEGDDVGSY